jgi:hypothetical protein
LLAEPLGDFLGQPTEDRLSLTQLAGNFVMWNQSSACTVYHRQSRITWVRLPHGAFDEIRADEVKIA